MFITSNYFLGGPLSLSPPEGLCGLVLGFPPGPLLCIVSMPFHLSFLVDLCIKKEHYHVKLRLETLQIISRSKLEMY